MAGSTVPLLAGHLEDLKAVLTAVMKVDTTGGSMADSRVAWWVGQSADHWVASTELLLVSTRVALTAAVSVDLMAR